MNLKIGIIQGRLTEAPPGRLQWSPNDYKPEFKTAKALGFEYLELFSERIYNPENPLWNKKKIKELKESCLIKNKLIFYSFVDDYILKNKIDDKLESYYQNLILILNQLKIKILTVPFYGINKINKKNYKNYLKFIIFISKKCSKSNIKLCIESNMSPDLFFIIKKSVKKNFYITFDTGNRILLKRDLVQDLIAFNKSIKHIHIKDKDHTKKNVQLGRGLVNFKSLFLNLKKIDYSGGITFETTRGKNSIISAKNNLLFIKKLL
jgi:sugar phosphate isomerase/epimerase|tara:strand:- start:1354 stop:2145 length:792 start_codon:yes stop_codon:yes gene_type:complete